MIPLSKDADLLIEDYAYLEMNGASTLEEYGDLLEQRYHQLSGTAHLYGQMIEAAEDGRGGAKGRLTNHWERYIDAAQKTKQVYTELDRRGYFEEESN